MLVAVSRAIKNKPTADTEEELQAGFRRINGAFDNLDLSLQELANEVQQGYAFCAQHGKGWRKKTNFLGAGFIAVDIDHGLRLEDAVNHSFVQEFGGFIYTSASHTPEDHRFRVVFELETPITDRDKMEAAYTGLIHKFGGDGSCSDACRMFYGNTAAVITMIGKKLPPHEVDSLTVRAEEVAEAVDTVVATSQPKATVRSRVLLDSSVAVTDRHGKVHRLVDLPPRTSIHCPVHIDNNPSAFTLKSGKGTPGIHCKTCNATFFIRLEGPYYDFDYKLDIPRAKNLEEIEEMLFDEDPLFGPETQKLDTGIRFVKERYLSDVNATADLVLIKSPKGSGKTEWLTTIVDKAKHDKQSVLLIGHRQSLIMNTAKRLALTPYIHIVDDPATGRSVIQPSKPTRYFAICVDSLSKLDARTSPFNIVIIDEVEQVIAHLTADTLRDRRRDALVYLRHYLQRAARVYCLDADLNRVSVNAIGEIMARGTRPALLVANDWVEPRGTMQLYDSKEHLTQTLREHLRDGRRCFVCSNSKEFVTKLKLSLEESFGAEKRFYLITSEESKSVEAQRFLAELPNSILQYDCLLVSPAVGTGIDISFPNNETKIHSVFGFFRSRVTTHFDIDQQLCRVRQPGEVRVWIEPRRFGFETDRYVLREEYLHAMHRDLGVVGLNEDGTPQYPEIDHAYATIYAEVKASQRASKNNLAENFCDLRRVNGWAVAKVQPTAELIEAGQSLLDRGEQLAEEAFIERVCQAVVITSEEYSKLVKKEETATLFDVETAAMRRYELEHFYLHTVSKELIELDDRARYRKAVKLFEMLVSDEQSLAGIDIHQHFGSDPRLSIDREEKAHKRRLLVKLFSAAGVFQEGAGFDTSRVITHDVLTPFIAECQAQKVTIERLLDRTLRNDLAQKPAQQLGELLRIVGLSLKKQRPKRCGDQKIYLYQVNADRLEAVEGIVANRQQLSGMQQRTTQANGDDLQRAIAAAVAEGRKRRKKAPSIVDELFGDDAELNGGEAAASTSVSNHNETGVAVDQPDAF